MTWQDGQTPLIAEIRRNLTDVQARIGVAAARAGRDVRDVTLLAVSKTVDLDRMQAAFSCGQRHFGENRVQEYLRKREAFKPNAAEPAKTAAAEVTQSLTTAAGMSGEAMADTTEDTIRWHFIGRLQTNKVRQLAGHPLLLHALDRMPLLEALIRQSRKTGCRWQVLVEVNVSGEESKAGVSTDALEALLRMASQSGCVDVRGLMTVAPDVADPELVRPVFRRLRELAVDIRSWKLDNVVMEHLSMGMSHDLDVAVEEGATIVRVGTAIFGTRA